jgi:GlpG protein
MRHIGQLPGGQARIFSDFLVTQGIRNEVDRENDGSYAIWIRDEDQVHDAMQLLSRYVSNPDAPEYSRAAEEAEQTRLREQKDLQRFRQRVRSRKSVFPQMGGYGVGILTYALIVVSIVFAVLTKLGTDEESLRPFFITDPQYGGRSLPEVSSGQVWRLFTPMFLHFGPIHLVFNMMWLYQLGCMIEARRSTSNLLFVIVVTELCSSLAQFYVTGHSNFGGMSGVVYGLAGYVWIRGKYDRASGLFLDTPSLIILLAWMVLCYVTKWFGPVANTAHLVGLISGMLLGGVSAYLARRSAS